jgi:ring-1,2-phenylacetyl-CoA epoxidase subunit PaaC
VTAPIARALALALADDELVLGYRESEWTGVAPMLEEDVALSSIAQDEIGHARALYLLCASLDAHGVESADVDAERADAVAFDRPPTGFRHARLCERPRGDWGEEIAKRALYELADAVRLDALSGTSWTALGQLLQKVSREEVYHLEHARAWLDRLSADEDARTRLQAGIDALWGDALGLFEPFEDEEALLEARILPVPSSILCTTFEAVALEELASRGLTVPEDVAAVHGGRRGRHSEAFAAQHAEMTMVRRLEPEGAPW